MAKAKALILGEMYGQVQAAMALPGIQIKRTLCFLDGNLTVQTKWKRKAPKKKPASKVRHAD